MRFKKGPQLPGAGRTRAGHHHGSHTPTSPEAILLGKVAHHTKQIRRECIICENVALLSKRLVKILLLRISKMPVKRAKPVCNVICDKYQQIICINIWSPIQSYHSLSRILADNT